MPTVRRLALLTLVLSGAMLLFGCGHDNSDRSGGDAASAGSSSPTGDAASSGQVTISIADRADFDALLETLRGKVILVDFWATWCSPCVEQFPHTVELYKQSDPEELAVVSVSMDEPADEQDVLAFLQKQGASFHNLLSKYGVSAEGFEAFEIDDGAVPHYKIYDRSGELRHKVSSSDEVDGLIEQLLHET